MLKRAIVLVVDGFGVGAMDDVINSRHQDIGSNTFKNIINANKKIKIPNLIKFGIKDYFVENKFRHINYHGFNISFGRSNLAHLGADSYIGHQEIAGTKPLIPIREFVREQKYYIIKELKKHKIEARFKNKMIFIGEDIVIADNIETDYGLNINVVGSIDTHKFSYIEQIGKVVRAVVKTGRVITMGGNNVTKDKLVNAFEIKKRDGYVAWGINIPKLQIYNENYHVIHMGYGVSPEKQVTQILLKNKYPVILIGKTADVIRADGAVYIPEIQTEKVLKNIFKNISNLKKGFIYANIQQTDLSGHEQKTDRYSFYLELIDNYLPKILSALALNDLFIITGDHGNDPTIGHSNHTREKTPIIMFSKKIKSHDIGERETLSDIGASISNFFGVDSPESGKSFI